MAARSSAPRSVAPLVVVLTLVGVFGVGLGLGEWAGGLAGLRDLASGRVEALRRSIPTSISIPSLGVRADVVEVGQARDGSIATPPTDPVATTGWYGLGPTPGEQGTAVIVGHVDTQTRAAVFHKLREVAKGKVIEVKRRDGRVAAFTVDSVEIFPKTAFPAGEVFGQTDHPRLVLVTCGGAWVGGDLGYAENVIVFATLR